MLFRDIAPQFADEITTLLREADEPALAHQVPALRIVARCRCGDDVCSSFYMAPAPQGAYGPAHRNVNLDPAIGMVVLDVVDQRIMKVEVLYNDAFRRRLHAAVP